MPPTRRASREIAGELVWRSGNLGVRLGYSQAITAIKLIDVARSSIVFQQVPEIHCVFRIGLSAVQLRDQFRHHEARYRRNGDLAMIRDV